MTRENFKKIIKLRSCWKIDKRKGDYKLPSGDNLSSYVSDLVYQQLEVDKIAIASDGNLYSYGGGGYNEDFVIWIPFSENETCSYDMQERRVNILIREITERF